MWQRYEIKLKHASVFEKNTKKSADFSALFVLVVDRGIEPLCQD